MFASWWNHIRLADESPCPFAARMLLECAHAMRVSTVWTVMAVRVCTGPGTFLPQIWERLRIESINAKEGLGRDPSYSL